MTRDTRNRRRWWVPFTPGGSMLSNMAEPTEAKAWHRLFAEIPPTMCYRSIAELQQRGYTVEQMPREWQP